MSDSSKAVFLSYASQDAEAAKRICEALRAAGVEVWFDQSELVGGDAWDHKIRTQIKDCALLIPIISANTQARTEGYFRLEWRLADQRTHLMAKGRPFLLPVVIDDTRDAEAQVPDSFTEVQWTRLPGGAGGEKIATRVKTLLSGGGTSSRESGSHPPIPASPELSPPRKTGKRWLIPAILGVVAITAIAFWFVRKPAANVGHETPDPRTQTQNPPLAAPLSEARQLVERARALMNKVNVLPGDLNTAAGMLEQAAKLAPNDALVWSSWAQLDLRYVALDFDNTPSRQNAARAHAAQANALDPASRDTRYTQAEVMRSLSWDPATIAAAEKILRPMLTEAPEDGRVPIQLGWVAFGQGRLDDAIVLFDRAALLPAFAIDATYCKTLVLVLRNRFETGDRALDQLLALEPTHAFALCNKAWLSVGWHEDLEAARDFITRIPPQMRVEDMSAYFAYIVYMFRREYDLAVQAIRAVPRDYLSAQPGPGPSGFYIGEALAAAGKNAAAEIEWQSALATVERRLAEAPSDETLMKFKALLLVRLGDRAAAERVWKAVVELHGDKAWGGLASALHVEFLPPDEAIAWLNGRLKDPQFWFTAASLRLNPVYDPLRANPKFGVLVDKMEADPRLSPKAKRSTEDGSQKTVPSSLLLSLSTSPDGKSVAVLAFANLSDDKGNEYFSDGISEELLNVLAKVPGLKVTARTSAFFFKGKQVPIADIAQQLGVAYVVEGSVRKAGERVRISAQLIKASDGFQVWSENFDRDLKDIFAVQDEIAGLVARQLQLKLGVTKPALAVNPEAHRLLLEARYYWYQRGEQNFDPTETLLNRALAIDPDFAPAHAAMADLWVMRAAYRVTEGAGDLSVELRSLRTSAARATDLDPTLVGPIAAMAYGLLIEGRMEAAQQQFEAAVALSPNDPTVRFWRALYLMENGDFDAAYQEFARARELDPKAWIIAELSGQNARQLGRREEALALFRQANADRPDGFAPAVGYESLVLWQSGRTDEAVAAARAVRQTWPGQPRWQADAHAIWVLRQAGLTKEAAAYADTLFAGLPAQTYQRGFILAALGRFDEALPYLERTSTLALDPIASLPIFDPWRDDPRFTALVEKLHWTEQYARAREAMKQAAVTAKR